MKIKQNKSLLAVGAILIACLITGWLSDSIHGVERRFEIRPQITVPEYRTDTARAIDAYERVMDRLMNLTESNLTGINTDLKAIVKKLVFIDSKLTDISMRMARIEKALSIEQPQKSDEKLPKEDKPAKPIIKQDID